MPVPLLAIVAESYADAGRSGEGMAAVDRAIATAERDADRFCLSELYRLRGELLLLGRTPLLRREAERHFDRAIEVARGQGARLFELLATIRLCRLRTRQEAVERCRACLRLFTIPSRRAGARRQCRRRERYSTPSVRESFQ